MRLGDRLAPPLGQASDDVPRLDAGSVEDDVGSEAAKGGRGTGLVTEIRMEGGNINTPSVLDRSLAHQVGEPLYGVRASSEDADDTGVLECASKDSTRAAKSPEPTTRILGGLVPPQSRCQEPANRRGS